VGKVRTVWFVEREHHHLAMTIIMNLNQDSQATSVFDTQFDHFAEDRRHLTSASDLQLAEPNWILDDSIPAPIRVLQLATGRWVAHLVGVAAELGLADLVQSGPKTTFDENGNRKYEEVLK
jgi:hypothetical protein